MPSAPEPSPAPHGFPTHHCPGHASPHLQSRRPFGSQATEILPPLDRGICSCYKFGHVSQWPPSLTQLTRMDSFRLLIRILKQKTLKSRRGLLNQSVIKKLQSANIVCMIKQMNHVDYIFSIFLDGMLGHPDSPAAPNKCTGSTDLHDAAQT
jgi:hypothetical protein